MSLPSLFNQPTDPDGWLAWAFNHAAHHYDVIAAIGVQKNVNGLSQYILSPMTPDSLETFLYYHQVMHNQANAVLGTTGYELLSLDWNDPDQFQDWLQLNGDEHLNWNRILGV